MGCWLAEMECFAQKTNDALTISFNSSLCVSASPLIEDLLLFPQTGSEDPVCWVSFILLNSKRNSVMSSTHAAHWLMCLSVYSSSNFVSATTSSAFVLGDQTASGAVEFWGDDWSTVNKLAGGFALDAFKGFAANTKRAAHLRQRLDH
jgi:hypothetical protein